MVSYQTVIHGFWGDIFYFLCTSKVPNLDSTYNCIQHKERSLFECEKQHYSIILSSFVNLGFFLIQKLFPGQFFMIKYKPISESFPFNIFKM